MSAVTWFAGAGLCLIGLLPGTSSAKIEGTRHDMFAMGLSAKRTITAWGVCSFCHIPHLTWSLPSHPNRYEVMELGVLVTYCHTCHMKAAVVDPRTGSRNVFRRNAHAAEVPAAHENRAGRGLRRDGDPPLYQTDGNLDKVMDCSSCHAVHDGTSRPFLRRYDPGDPDILGSLCRTCHQDRVPAGAGKRNVNKLGFSAHPIGVKPARAPSWIVPADHGGTSVPAAPSWRLGAHLDPSGSVTCVTCHAMHGEDPLDGGAPPRKDLLAVGGDELCLGCHSAEPQGALLPGHWAGMVTSRPGKSLAARTVAPSEARLGDGEPTCLFCHDIHFGAPGTPCLVLTSAGSSVDEFCRLCHPDPSAPSCQVSPGEGRCADCHRAHVRGRRTDK